MHLHEMRPAQLTNARPRTLAGKRPACRTRRIFAVCLAWLGCGIANAATVIEDGDFVGWQFHTVASDDASAKVTVESKGGHPGARLIITTVSGSTAMGIALAPVSLQTPLRGAQFDLSLEVRSGPGAFGQGQAIGLILHQRGTFYVSWQGTTDYPLAWDRVIFSGVIDAATFVRLEGDGPETPDLRGGIETFLGFVAENSRSGTLTQFYDNVVLTLHTAAPKAGSRDDGLAGYGRLGDRYRTPWSDRRRFQRHRQR